ncbi:MAG: arsenical pump-driving ATPase [Proteobacteria bacterium]|nr:arsenical pump-driving ATPase [Pseudomonadota bacterium]
MGDLNATLTRLSKATIQAAFHTKYLFFTGKGGVGKTSLASASAVTMASRGKRVLLISTDPASNLDETLGITLTNHATPVPEVPGLMALNINPDAAAEEYRQRVIAPMIGKATDVEISGLREQLSGACTVEIAAFDEFAALLSDEGIASEFDTIIFDTAPTGHTIRLLSLPKAWTSFFDINERGASCLGPHSALKNQESRFAAAFDALKDPKRTTVVLVARPELSTLNEAARTSTDLQELQLTNQILVINGVFLATDKNDRLAQSFENKSTAALSKVPQTIQDLPRYIVPLKPFNTVGLKSLKKLLEEAPAAELPMGLAATSTGVKATLSLAALAKELAQDEHGLVLVMGKGGVGKTTVAAALAVAIAKLGKPVHLTTTDPAAHLAQTIVGTLPNLTVSRIDPKEETRLYTDKILASKGKNLDADGLALLREDLASPCTEEVAVFHAFAKTVFEGRRGIVILDTAPTGHTLLLLDAAGSYHREMLKKMEENAPGKLTTPLMMLQDSTQSKVLLVTLAETTPVSEAAALQHDLRRASIEPYGWVVNRSLAASSTSDPVLIQRAANEHEQLQRIMNGLATRVAILPLMPDEPVGIELLDQMLAQEWK